VPFRPYKVGRVEHWWRHVNMIEDSLKIPIHTDRKPEYLLQTTTILLYLLARHIPSALYTLDPKTLAPALQHPKEWLLTAPGPREQPWPL